MQENILTKPEVDALLDAAGGEEWPADESGASPAVDQPESRVVDYSFKRSHLSQASDLHRFIGIHDELCQEIQNDLAFMLNTEVSVTRASAQPHRYRDFIGTLSDTTYMLLVDAPPLPGTALVEANLSLLFGILDLLLGGDGSTETIPHKPTAVELSVWKPFLDKILDHLGGLMRPVVPAMLTPRRVETNPLYARAAPLEASLMVITLDAKIGLANGVLNFCYPLPMVQAVLAGMRESEGQLDNYYGRAEPEDTERLIVNALMDVQVRIDALVGNSWIRARDWLDLGPGDIVPLNASLNSHVHLEVQGRDMFLGRPGKAQRNLAVKIEEEVGRADPAASNSAKLRSQPDAPTPEREL
jgi:flagellar motor switch protein FliM